MPGPSEAGEPDKLQKVLARAGVGSRRVCEELIEDGRVTVDGVVAHIGQRVDPATGWPSRSTGCPWPPTPTLVHYLLNKPAGVVTTADDPQGRPTVVDLVPAEPRVFPVGSARPRHRGAARRHQRRRAGPPAHPPVVRHREGVPGRGGGHADPGRRCGPCARGSSSTTAGPPRPAPRWSVDGLLRLTIHEGRNRQVRRMCEAVGHPVRRLVRTRIGPIADRLPAPGHLAPPDPRRGAGRCTKASGSRGGDQ